MQKKTPKPHRPSARSTRRRRPDPLKRSRAPIYLLLVLVLAMAFFYYLVNWGPLAYRRHTVSDLPYHDLFIPKAQEYGLSPYLVAGVIQQESAFKPKAESPVGARGLMQVMPDTGRYIARKRGLDFDPDDLYRPETNIDYGCWYLSYLMKRFDGVIPTVLAAYNAGPNITQKWLEDPEYSKDGRTLTRIPYGETDRYVVKVMGYMEDFRERSDTSDQ